LGSLMAERQVVALLVAGPIPPPSTNHINSLFKQQETHMKNILVVLVAAMFTFVNVAPSFAQNCPYGKVNGVCIQGERLKSLPTTRGSTPTYPYKLKRCLFKSRCDYKVIVKTNQGKAKVLLKLTQGPRTKSLTGTDKSFVWLAPIVAGIPETSIIVGTVVVGVIGGAASVIGTRVGEKIWPTKPEPKPAAVP
jgi:hypothetical protein